MKVGDLVKVYGTNPPLIGVVLSLGWNESFKDSKEINWDSNPDVHIMTQHGRRTCRMLTLETINEDR